jgi:hypothetical protein
LTTREWSHLRLAHIQSLGLTILLAKKRPHHHTSDFEGEFRSGGFGSQVYKPLAGGQFRISRYERQEDFSKVSAFAESLLRWSPILFPILACQIYDPEAELFAGALTAISKRNWVAVDGGAYQAKIIAPAINGVIMPSISLLVANLIGNTVSTLRQRQLDIRTTINIKAGQLRILQSMLDSFPQGVVQDNCRYYLMDYSSRLISEGHETVDLDASDHSGIDGELYGVLNELHSLSATDLVPTQ